jgi:thiol:disulfide interchange protein DsbD
LALARCCQSAGGRRATGWGFQPQSPAVVAGLAALFTPLANLAGVFDFGSIPPSRQRPAGQNPGVNHFCRA